MKPEKIPAKSISPSDQSDSIIVSFGPEWHSAILEGKIRGVIRKRIPKSFRPHWIYFHINAPVGAVCARSNILSVDEIEVSDATSRQQELCLSREEIESYLNGETSIGYYSIGPIAVAVHPATSDELRQSLVYHPPQSFLILSNRAKAVIDSLCRFD